MSLVDLQRRFRELGRLRTGEKAPTGNGRSRPAKRSEWRLTSPSEALLDNAAKLYGGEVREWADSPGQGRQWELCTGTDTLDVLIPPGEPISQSWELWSGGGCQRRCDGRTTTDGEVCLCPFDLAERLELSKKGEACKPTTRLSVVLPRVPDVGVWRLESHGVNAAVELPGTVNLLRAALSAGHLLPAALRIEQRTSVKDGETRHFIVPVLELHSITVAELQSGSTVAALGAATGGDRTVPAPEPTAALPAPAKPAARPALPDEQPADPAFVENLRQRLNAIAPPERFKECKRTFGDRFGRLEHLTAAQAHAAEVFVAGWKKVPTETEAEDMGAPFEAAQPAKPKRQMTAAQKLHMFAKECGVSEADLDAVILTVTGGRTSSAKALDVDVDSAELAKANQACQDIKDGRLDMADVREIVAQWQADQAATAP